MVDTVAFRLFFKHIFNLISCIEINELFLKRGLAQYLCFTLKFNSGFASWWDHMFGLLYGSSQIFFSPQICSPGLILESGSIFCQIGCRRSVWRGSRWWSVAGTTNAVGWSDGLLAVLQFEQFHGVIFLMADAKRSVINFSQLVLRLL